MKKQEKVEKLRELLKGSNSCMLSTYNVSTGIHARPMAFNELTDDGEIYFFTNEYSAKTEEISVNNEVSISMTNESKSNYIVLKATASLVKDKAKMEELFNTMVKLWFPDGLKDPNMALIKADITSAEYWDSTSSTMVFLFNAAKSLISGEVYDGGEHGEIKL
jgi:general stress protein 26